MTHSAIELDAETLQRCLRLGGLEVSGKRATTLLPVVSALRRLRAVGGARFREPGRLRP